MSDQTTPPSRFRLPPAGPSAADVADRDLWEKAAEGSLASVQAAAEKWRTGLAAFVTLVTSGLLLKGPEAASDLSDLWRTILTVLGGGGLALAVLGLWQALRAAGTASKLRYEDVIGRHGSFKQYQVAAANVASSSLGRARMLVGWSLMLLGITVFAWWWAPTEPTHVVKVAYGSETVCGKLESADDQEIAVKPDGASKTTTVPFPKITNIYIVDTC